jgi:glycosyltransferase involved in cell wall biosynthesis
MSQQIKSIIFQLGNDQLTPKATYYPNELKKFNFATFYFSEDRSGQSADTIEKENLDAVIAPKNLINRWYKLFVYFIQKRPVSVELYLSQRPWHLFYYYLLARIFDANIVIWCRGELRNYNIHHPLRRFVNRFLLKYADKILLRELYMKDILLEEKIYRPEHTLFFPNAIPISDIPIKSKNRPKKVLFLNSFKGFRNIELIIEAAEVLHKRYPDLRYDLVGSTLDNQGYSPSKKDYELMLRNMVSDRNLDSVVRFYPFSSDRFKYFEDALAFILPADIVFCNYTLLEAMSQKIPAIVANTEGANLIVDDGLTGFIVERDASSIADAIERLYLNESLREKMGCKSREKIIKDYNVSSRAQILAQIYRDA